ncbi:flagellin/flagellar hook associated protein [Rhizobium sp. DKSPLA3]|uniref:Flagellin n=1 Tax=Rhizobium quercicola TaxID=2901226 RepID=A0A9X1T6V0_9HYPH|nr:flagellin [Rhizobium quercicola]MCD7109123.1 flagellin/flagellar hook associated protein [Rhizobium quercicola]
MTSLLTNTSAMAALQTLRGIASRSAEAQQQISSGMRVETAADNAAYWSIATTMRSDNKAMTAVTDVINLGSAQIDTAYNGITAVSDILSEFTSRLIAAKEPGVDPAKIQKELSQLQQQVVSVANAASFSGVNWLKTDVADINDTDLNRVSLVNALHRSENGLSLGTTDFHLSEVSLFNKDGGGILQADTRKLKTLGGVRVHDTFMDNDGVVRTFPDNAVSGENGRFGFTFTGPLTFGASDKIEFDVTVDADNPADLDPPYHPGKTTHVTIDRAFVDTWLPGQNGVIVDYKQYASVLDRALSAANAGAYANLTLDGRGGTVPNHVNVGTSESSGLNGSSIEITNLTGSAAGLSNRATDYGSRGSQMVLSFEPFKVYPDGDNKDGVRIDFDFSVNGAPATHHSFDRTYVNALLGKDTGEIQTADEMVTLLHALVGSSWPNVIIEATSPGTISVRSDKDVDRLSGSRTGIGFNSIGVSIEPLAEQNFLDIDIVANPDWLDRYIGYIEVVSAEVIDAGAVLGALDKRMVMQRDFTQTLMSNLDKGVGRLVDAEMNEASTRVKALQTQQQLAIQSLQIANSNSQNILQLFQ